MIVSSDMDWLATGLSYETNGLNHMLDQTLQADTIFQALPYTLQDTLSENDRPIAVLDIVGIYTRQHEGHEASRTLRARQRH